MADNFIESTIHKVVLMPDIEFWQKSIINIIRFSRLLYIPIIHHFFLLSLQM